MILSGLNFVAVTALVKHVGSSVPAAESAFIRYLLGLVFLLPMIRPILAARLTRRQVAMFALRGALQAAGVILWFYSMTQITIAEVTALNYMNPVFVTLGAALILGEALPPRRLVAVLIALAGAMVILRPGIREIETGHLTMILTALMFAAAYMVVKVLSGEVGAVVIVGMLSIMTPIFLAPFAFAVWVTPSLAEVGWLFLVACFATAGHYAMTRAFAAAPLTVTQPATFLQLIWAVAVGMVFFGEPIDGMVVLGAALILAAVTYITWRESRARRRAAAEAGRPAVAAAVDSAAR
ncbi:membrane protein, putative [Oceanicola granulosus HTCC2516]|uniref:Membrane protein, putative n=2 Tax=Oceanicola granulosus TaxID=252302 RepID=Q2CAS9_OCEGH|nr:DMT family transporter [Oceanicola granulosus]EAR49759.1 membrane protein, putative [Oceanicola granulosus HTCC2516]